MSILSFEYKYTSDAILSWKSLSHAEIPPEPANRFEKVWDTVASTSVYNDADQARLKAANHLTPEIG